MGVDMRIINGVRYRPEDAPAQPEPADGKPAAPSEPAEPFEPVAGVLTADEAKANRTAKAKTAQKTGKEA